MLIHEVSNKMMAFYSTIVTSYLCYSYQLVQWIKLIYVIATLLLTMFNSTFKSNKDHTWNRWKIYVATGIMWSSMWSETEESKNALFLAFACNPLGWVPLLVTFMVYEAVFIMWSFVLCAALKLNNYMMVHCSASICNQEVLDACAKNCKQTIVLDSR